MNDEINKKKKYTRIEMLILKWNTKWFNGQYYCGVLAYAEQKNI